MGRGRRPNFIILVVWNAVTAGGWVVLALGRSCLVSDENSSPLFRVFFSHIVSARSQSVRGAFHQPAFMDSCLTINDTYLPCLPRQFRKIPCVTQGGGRGCEVVIFTPYL